MLSPQGQADTVPPLIALQDCLVTVPIEQQGITTLLRTAVVRGTQEYATSSKGKLDS